MMLHFSVVQLSGEISAFSCWGVGMGGRVVHISLWGTLCSVGSEQHSILLEVQLLQE